jgi:hypothetical protein
MTKLQEWLKEQGLEQYAGVLTESDIDLDITFRSFRRASEGIESVRPAAAAVQPRRNPPITSETLQKRAHTRGTWPLAAGSGDETVATALRARA